VGCASCHGGDPRGETALDAHRDMFLLASGAETITSMCGRCHKEPASNFNKSPHHLAMYAARRPDCTTCHGSHGIAKASLDLIGEPLCSSCHPVAQARRIHKALGDAETEVAVLDSELARAGNNADQRARLIAARSQLRGLSHALDLISITRASTQTLTLADEIRARSLPQAGARRWAHGLRIAALVLAALMSATAAIWGFRWLRARKLSLPRPRGKELTIVAAVLGVLVVAAGVAGYRGYRYIEHDPKFCLSCHTMNSAYALWEQSAHKNIECHTCHAPDVASNLHQLFVYATRKPDEVVKHAEIDRSVCERCHASGGSASKWNRVLETPGHRVHVGKQRIECVQCHAMSVHRFRPPKENCATCHRQVTLAAAGSMSEMHCQGCHPFADADARRPLKPDRAACLDCHENRQVGEEVFPAKAPMKWDCGKCHKPHEKLNLGNADCFKCHDTMTEGVHRVKGHGECLQCHKPHGWATQAETCNNCHTNIKAATHHSTAGKSCKDCHGAWDDEFQGPHAGKAAQTGKVQLTTGTGK
jgi:predicted CXXCH cytochrome family protein